MLGAHAMGQKEAMYEEAMKVPWLMRVGLGKETGKWVLYEVDRSALRGEAS